MYIQRIPVLMVVLLCLALLAAYFSFDEQKESYESIIAANESEIRQWRNQADLARAETRSVVADRQTLKRQYATLFDSLETHMQLKIKNIEQVVQVGSVIEREVYVPVLDTLVLVDSVFIPVSMFHFEDKWLTAEGFVFENKLRLVYTSRDSLSLVTSWKRPGRFPGKYFRASVLHVDAVSCNPFSTVTGLQHIAIKERPKRLGIGPYVGISPQRFSYGISVHYSIIQF